jgi:hypothetical protein
MGGMDADDFFEEDEPVEKIRNAFEQGTKGVTMPPVQGTQRGQNKYIGTGLVLAKPSQSLSNSLPTGQSQPNH